MIREEADSEAPHAVPQSSPGPPGDPCSQRASRLEEGDFEGAVRLTSLEDSTAESNDRTLQALKENILYTPYPSIPPMLLLRHE